MICGVEINKDVWYIYVKKKKIELKVIVKNMIYVYM